MNFKTKFLLFFTCISFTTQAQTIKGSFPQAKNNEIIVSGFSGFATKDLAKTSTDSLGNFEWLSSKDNSILYDRLLNI